jgi:hypothetical protein
MDPILPKVGASGKPGTVHSIQTTVLLTVEETLAALRKASSIKYRPPGDEAWRE